MSDAAPLGPAGRSAERLLVNRYRLKRLLAKGGMAEVWEAVDDVLGRPVAVKVLHPHLAADESFRERFRREAIAAARLAHPNVVATFDTGADEGTTFIVMELVEGPTLRQILDETGPLAPGRTVHVGAQVADALHYAHRAGIVHRDVKPANILVSADGRVKVADFGIAKAVEESEPERPSPSDALTVAGSIIGTAQYLAPEQVDDRAVDARTDVYALGVVLYEMVCGRPPFTGQTDMAVALKHITTAPPPLATAGDGLPQELEKVVLRAMAKAPADRYQSATDLRTALLAADLNAGAATSVVAPPAPPRRPPAPEGADHTPPRGVPPSFAKPDRRWVMPAVAAVAVALTLGVVGVLFAGSDTGRRLIDEPGTTGTTRVLPKPTPSSFDPPPGSEAEHESELPFLVDGDPSTLWETETYANRNFGGLKAGVGVILDLGGPYQLRELKVTTPSGGWSAEVLVAASPQATRAAWGEPVATKRGIGRGTTTFDLDNRTAGAVLLWITDLGQGNAGVSIGELVLR